MRNFIYHAPTKVIFGTDAEQQVGPTLAEAGFRHVMVLYGGGSVKKTGLLDAVTASLESSNITYVTLGGVDPNPKITFVREGIELAKKEQF